MLFECLDLWVPLVFIQGELALSSIQRRVDSVFEMMLRSVILQPILPSVANTDAASAGDLEEVY